MLSGSRQLLRAGRLRRPQPPLCNGPGRLLLACGQFTFREVPRRGGGIDTSSPLTPAAPLALPLGELSPQVTERAKIPSAACGGGREGILALLF